MMVALGSSGMTVEAPRQCETARKDRVESLGAYVDDVVSRGHIFLVTVFFRTDFPRSDGLSPGEG